MTHSFQSAAKFAVMHNAVSVESETQQSAREIGVSGKRARPNLRNDTRLGDDLSPCASPYLPISTETSSRLKQFLPILSKGMWTTSLTSVTVCPVRYGHVRLPICLCSSIGQLFAGTMIAGLLTGRWKSTPQQMRSHSKHLILHSLRGCEHYRRLLNSAAEFLPATAAPTMIMPICWKTSRKAA